MSALINEDDSNEPDSDDPASRAFDQWLDARDRGKAIDLAALTAPLSPAERARFFEWIDGFSKVEEVLEEGAGRRVDFEALGAAKRYQLKHEPAYPPRPGGMGCVYRAQDVELGREVAYKVSHEDGRSEEFRKRFTREARTTSTLRYPGIVPIFGMIDDDSGRPAYAMEYIEGKTFREIVTDDQSSLTDPGPIPRAVRPFPFRDRLRQFIAACRIVNHAHQQRVIHGDLSLKNLMLTTDGAVYVVDWGLARRGDELDLAPRLGTPGYVPLSVEKGLRQKSAWSDVYSLGMILAALLAGLDQQNRPRTNGTGRAIPRAIRAIIRRAITDQDDEAKPDAAAGLGPEPRDRSSVRRSQRLDHYPDAGTLADDVQRFLDDEAVCADQLEPWSRILLRWSRHHPHATASLGAGLLSIVVVFTAIQFIRAQAAIAQAQVQKAQSKQETEAFRAATARFEAEVSRASAKLAACERSFGKLSGSELGEVFEPLFPIVRLCIKALCGPEEATKLDKSFRKYQNEVKLADRVVDRNLEEPLSAAIDTFSKLISDYPHFQPGRLWLARCNNALVTFHLIKWLPNNSLGLLPHAYQHLFGRFDKIPGIDSQIIILRQMLEVLPEQPNQSVTAQQLEKVKTELYMMLATLHLCTGRFAEATQELDVVQSSGDKRLLGLAEIMSSIARTAAEIQLENLPWSQGPDIDHRYATRMAQYLASRAEVSPKVLFDAGRTFALASVDEKLTDEQRSRTAKQSADYLVRMERLGVFQDAAWLRRLKTDEAFKAIKDRSEFALLLKRTDPNHP